jgi:hypothetical protein
MSSFEQVYIERDTDIFNSESPIIKMMNLIIIGDLQGLKKIISTEIEGLFLNFDHPCQLNTKTYAFAQKKIGIGNFISFSDELNSENNWILVQLTNFIDAFIYQEKIYSIYRQNHPLLDHLCETFLNLTDNSKKERTPFEGFIVGQDRPYHFFYDQFIHLNFYKKFKDKIFVLDEDNIFFDIAILGITPSTGNKTNIFLSPNLIDRSFLEISSVPIRQLAISMERDILNSVVSSNALLRPNYQFILWLGVTGQKRSWIDQVDGYVKIINMICSMVESVLVIFDGITSSTNGKVNANFVDEDTAIVNQIIANIKASNFEYRNLVGSDYKTKIKFCSFIDLFISNAGSGSITPLRLCKKPGILHTNSGLVTFDDIYSDSVVFIPKEFITDIKEDGVPIEYINYRIDPEIISRIFSELVWRLFGLLYMNNIEFSASVFTPSNFNDSYWIKGVNQEDNAFFVKFSNKAWRDFKVGKEIIFNDGIVRKVSKITHDNSSNCLIVDLSGDRLSHDINGHPNLFKLY